MYTAEYGLAAIAIALFSLLSVPLYSHLRTNIFPWTRPVLDNNVGGLAKRVVVIVCDGLEAEAALRHFTKLESELNYKPIVKTTSLVEPPTESRAAHGQLLCGVGEEPKALLTGFKRYTRQPDSVLREAPFAVAIGAPDVVPFFTGANVHVDTFPPSDYHSIGISQYILLTLIGDARQLDEWTVTRLRDLLQHGTEHVKVTQKLGTTGTVFFLHLAGVDTTGHRHGSHSPQYHHHHYIHLKLIL
jgi:phosphatidylinositol glycan class N